MLNKVRLLTPGPTPLPERVRLALAADMIHHRTPAFAALLDDIQIGLKHLFGTEQPVLPLSCSGTGAMTAAVHGLFSPGDKVIVVEAGKFGQRWSGIARTRGLVAEAVQVPWGQAVDVAAVEERLAAHPDARGVLVQLSETSTGALQPIEALGRLMRGRDALLVVDGISAVGISPCPMDEWGVDCLLTGSQKGLMLPPGLALLALSERGWRRAEATAPSCFYFNLPGERKNLAKGQGLFTSPVNLIVGLRESLRLFFEDADGVMRYEEGLRRIYRKQWALTCMTRAGVKALGLSLFAPTDYAWGLTSVLLPEGVDGERLIRAAKEDCGVIFAGGQDHLKGRLVRFAHMGWVDWGDVAAGLAALAHGLRAAGGYTTARDYVETALAANRQALDVDPGRVIPDVRS